MTIDDVIVLVAPDESRHLELKKTTGELKDGMHSACAFLNTEGGWLIFGVAPNSKKIIGQEVTDATKRSIAQALSGLEPAVFVDVRYIDVPDRPGCQVIAMQFDGWSPGQRPYTFHGKPYIKIESTTVPMPREMFEERIRNYRPETFSWEMLQSDKAITDLNHDLIMGSVRIGVAGGRMPESALAEPIETILYKSELLTDGKPNNGAVVLFAKDTIGYPQLKIRMARFLGTDKNEFIDNQQVQGNFFDLLDAGMSFFFKHLNLNGVIKGLQRDERLEIPVTALREALINALSHRKFESRNLSIGIAIFDDRVEISNPGVFPPQITSATIKQPHDSYPYNPAIAQFLYRAKWLENWGSGTLRIIDACAECNLPEPKWEVRGDFIVLTFLRPVDSTKVATPVTTPVAIPVTAPVNALLKVMGDECYSMKELMGLMGLKNISHFKKQYLQPAIVAGVIEPTEKPRHPKQRYRRKK